LLSPQPSRTSADTLHHGGADRRACVFPAEHYSWWKSEHGYDLGFGAFSENLSVEGLREENIYIGDIVRMGTTLDRILKRALPITADGALG
jgi:MOSC domain-containing protein YiiM